MPTFAILWRSAIGAAIALAVGLACTVLSAAASVAPMTGMGDDAAPVTTVAVTVAEDVASVSPAMTSMCAYACVDGSASVVCAGAAGLVVTSALVLLLASRRDTYLGLLARLRRAGLARRRLRARTPWLVLSPVSLCVFRV